MRYVYIAGLEHSGTTLLSDVLSQHRKVVALGEVGQYLSPPNMETYMKRWGRYDDARLCSCGKEWESCTFWSCLYHLCGVHGDGELGPKYAAVLNHCREVYSPDHVFLDSSKTLGYLDVISQNLSGRKDSDVALFLLWMVKDVRSFSTSIVHKSGSHSLRRVMQAFNWWLSVNRQGVAYLRSHDVPRLLVQYENLCFDPENTSKTVYAGMEMGLEEKETCEDSESHIVLGNKDYLTRNRGGIHYDSRWFTNDLVSVAYLLHPWARKWNRYFYQEAI